MRRRGLEPMHDNHVNVTPLIDVIMCLIIFFLVCGRLAAQESNDKVVIPQAQLGQELSEQRDRLLINIVPSGDPAASAPEIYIRGQSMAPADLTAYLQREKRDAADVKVILRADRDIPYQYIAPVLVSCANAGIKNVNFSTKRPE